MGCIIKSFASIAFILILVMCCIMFCRSIYFEPRLPMTHNYTLVLKVVDNDTVLCPKSRVELDSLVRALSKSEAEKYQEGINDVRQETNNIINKINGWLSFWLAMLALMGGIMPLLISWRKEQEYKERFNEETANMEKQCASVIDEINKNKDKLTASVHEEKEKIEQSLKQFDFKQSHLKITNLVSAFLAARNNRLIQESIDRDLLRDGLLFELQQEFGYIVDNIINVSYTSEKKSILMTILIQYYALFASLQPCLRHPQKLKQLKETMDNLQTVLTLVSEDTRDKDHIYSEIKKIRNEMKGSMSLFYHNN